VFNGHIEKQLGLSTRDGRSAFKEVIEGFGML